MSDVIKKLGKEIEDLKRISKQLKQKAHEAESPLEEKLQQISAKCQEVEQQWRDIHHTSGHELEEKGNKINEALKSMRHDIQQMKKKLKS